ncbi:MAG: AI-2E family transporter [Lachnospiraceae bacterium]|jgi:predicted PurR-regulated permease PerM|nr:AI-2E family transporter [Lachnospiraceae bacterium]
MTKNGLWAKWFPVAVIAILLMVVYKTFDNISGISAGIKRFLNIIAPLLYGVIFTYFMYIPCGKLSDILVKSKIPFIAKKSRFFGIVTVFLLFVLVIVVLVLIIAPIIIAGVIDLANSIPGYAQSLMAFIEKLDDETLWAQFNISGTLTSVVNDNVARFFDITLVGALTRAVTSFAGGIVDIVLGLIITLYILIDVDNIIIFFRRMSNAYIKNAKYRTRLHLYLGKANTVLFTFIASKSLDCLINMLSVTTILLLFNVPYAILFGFIAGLFNFIPYLGTLVAVTCISLITLITGGLGKTIPLLVVLMIFQQLDANFIEPRIMNASLKISPIVVIISVIAAGAYFGIPGMFLAVPVMAVIKQLMLEYIEQSEKKS